jgi:hypothetical protein
VLTKIESRVVRQPDSRTRRSWYQSAQADVVLIHDALTGDLLSFEIEFEGGLGLRRAYITWARAIGLRTGCIDTGEDGGALHYKQAPMILWHPRPRVDCVEEGRRLIKHSGIEEGLRESILQRLSV